MSAPLDWPALRRAFAQGHPSIETVATLRGCSLREAARHIAADLGLACWDCPLMARRVPAFEVLPLPQCQAMRCVLLLPPEPGSGRDAIDGDVAGAFDGCIAVISEPLDTDLRTRLSHRVAGPVRFVLAAADDIHAFLNQQEAKLRAMDTMQGVPGESSGQDLSLEELSLARLSTETSPAVRLVNSTLYDALRAGASDLHLAATPDGLAIQYRIDGVLDTVAEIPGIPLAEQAVSRLKVLAELDIAERRVPQDGSFRVRAQEREIDLRLSVIPGLHGEDAVVRILDKQAMVARHGRLDLASLGLPSDLVAGLRELMDAAWGMLLVTGPTGSGKTTTLYAALSEAHTGRDKIVTIEDPVEYQLPGVLQIRVNEKKGLSFARGLRSILRHDPDKIMVGEIRDRETAEIAVQSALTGHLVLSTAHANSVFDVFGRFTHMGLDPHALMSALNGIWAQRLVRLTCTHCSRACEPADHELARLGLSQDQVAGWNLRRGSGCGDCRGTGYRGRQAVAELLRLTDELRELIIARQPARLVREAAYRSGTRSLKDSALALARTGATSLEEVRRVTVAA
ncbi:type II/IV secretion system protein [Ramlibacter sp. AW1]|uniref:Type II/IV secretion system protein n=1 Tax=Ramlibacter aurantiacus TaxID=2801330 RepID=A0A936ZMR5_9BURK|nr:GspE/PulE family protein [Ramlibacter aurantiacus]MBL0420153.1 type II/IV secretion system protein [Ramlibacter aurantiacus]